MPIGHIKDSRLQITRNMSNTLQKPTNLIPNLSDNRTTVVNILAD
jgi:hypothetical protein